MQHGLFSPRGPGVLALNRLAGALVFVSALAVVGCSSDSGSDACAAGDVTSLCGSTALNALTAAEATQLCMDTSAYVAQSMDRATGCKYVAIVAAASSSSPTDAQMQAACSNAENMCIQDETVKSAGEKTQCGTIPTTCTATIEQYSTCVMGEAEVFEQGAIALTSCSTLTFQNLSDVYDVPMTAAGAPSCAALKTACPSFSVPYID